MTDLRTADSSGVFAVERLTIWEAGQGVELTRWPGAVDAWQVHPEGLGRPPWHKDLIVHARDDDELLRIAQQVCRILAAYRGTINEAETRMRREISHMRSTVGWGEHPTTDAASTPVAADSRG